MSPHQLLPRPFAHAPSRAQTDLLFLARRFRLAAAILVLSWPVSACTSWQSLPMPQPTNAHHVEVLTPSGRELTVWYPELKGDSLFGAASPDRKSTADIRLGDLRTLKIRRFSAGRTVLLVAGVGVGATLVAAVAFAIAYNHSHGI